MTLAVGMKQIIKPYHRVQQVETGACAINDMYYRLHHKDMKQAPGH